MNEAFASLSVAEATAALHAHDVPCGEVVALADVPDEPQVAANHSIVEYNDPTVGRIQQPKPPARFRGSPAEMKHEVPLAGHHTDSILADIGYSVDRITELRADGIVGPESRL